MSKGRQYLIHTYFNFHFFSPFFPLGLSSGVYYFPQNISSVIFQIVHWKNHLKFPEDARLTPEAKDLILRLLSDVEHRLGTNGPAEIKVCIYIDNNICILVKLVISLM